MRTAPKQLEQLLHMCPRALGPARTGQHALVQDLEFAELRDIEVCGAGRPEAPRFGTPRSATEG
eukprot:13677625-Alexandrium_andersonii.AAC.1